MNFFDTISTDLLVSGNKRDIERVFYRFPFDSCQRYDEDFWIIPWWSAARIYRRDGWKKLKKIRLGEITRDQESVSPLDIPEPIKDGEADISPVMILKSDTFLDTVQFQSFDYTKMRFMNNIYQYKHEIKTWIQTTSVLINDVGNITDRVALSIICDTFVRRWWRTIGLHLPNRDIKEMLWNRSVYSTDIKYEALCQIYEDVDQRA